jgi:peptide/nickel transport system ATP-binding protein
MNLSACPGKVLGISGPSGCGKSTLGRIMAGYESPVSGRVLMDGKPVERKGFHPVQLIAQHPEKSVNPRWRMDRVLNEGYTPSKEILEDLGIKPAWLNRRPSELSSGELQRFCVARTLNPKTRYLVADEITTMLDAVTQAGIFRFILDFVKKNAIGLFVISHDRALLERVCDTVMEWPAP